MTHVERLRAIADVIALNQDSNLKSAAHTVRECAAEMERMGVELAEVRAVNTQLFDAVKATAPSGRR
jgi:hypothetical protein